MARDRQSKSAELAASPPKPCLSCSSPLYGGPPFCPFCGKAQDAPEPPEPSPTPLGPPPSSPATSLAFAMPSEPEAAPSSAEISQPAQVETSSANDPAPEPSGEQPGPISGVLPKPLPKPKRSGLIISLVVLALVVLWLVGRCSGGGKPGRVAHVYDVGNHWVEIETPASGDFALTADSALRIRSSDKTWFVPSNAHANLDELDPKKPVEVRTVGGRTRVQVLAR